MRDLVKRDQTGAMLCAFNHPDEQRVLEHLEFHEPFALPQWQTGNRCRTRITRFRVCRIGSTQLFFEYGLLLSNMPEVFPHLLRRSCSPVQLRLQGALPCRKVALFFLQCRGKLTLESIDKGAAPGSGEHPRFVQLSILECLVSSPELFLRTMPAEGIPCIAQFIVDVAVAL